MKDLTFADEEKFSILNADVALEEGAEECQDKVIANVKEVPEEVCDLNPQKICRLVTKVVLNHLISAQLYQEKFVH